jgi:hypothetical protein
LSKSPRVERRLRHARLGRKHRMASGENKAHDIVANVIVDRGIEIGLRCLSSMSSS